MAQSGQLPITRSTLRMQNPADMPTATEITPTATRKPRTRPRGIAVNIIAAVALIYILDWAQSFFVSLLVGILIAYTLNPLVTGLKKLKIWRPLGATIVMIGVLCALVFGAYSIRGQVQTIINQLPSASSKISNGLASLQQKQRRNMAKVESAARALENATNPTKPVEAPDPDVPQVQVVFEQPPMFRLSSVLLTSSVGAIGVLGQIAMVIFLVYFLLLAGGTFKRKLVRLAGPSLSHQKITIVILDDINQSIQRYTLMLLVTNVLLGIVTWIAFTLIGLENAGAWAVAAGVLHLIPYFGPAVTAGLTGMAGFVQFNAFSDAMLVAGTSLAIATTVGTFVQTWMTGHMARMNSAAIFIALLFFGWLWGVWGMLLSIPIVVIVKVITQQIERLRAVAELLSE
ncbi:MAG: AI-2E family transporter [Gammaproteobacteria bacterium]|nr:AI-2E family transporter [Gammaproteobacteria bacterium]